MIIGSTKEPSIKETRTSLTPNVVEELSKLGHTILLEKNIGKKSKFSNSDYIYSKAKFLSSESIYQKSDIILQITPPSNQQINQLNKNQILISDFSSTNFSKITTKATLIKLEQVPRTASAQSIDILSSQHTIRGYSAALYALIKSNRIAPQIFTASTSLKQSKALIIGASITGLQASSTLKRNGVDVTIADINENTKELAQSVGANFINSNNILSILNNQDFIISTAKTKSNQPILNLQNLNNLKNYSIIIDTTPNNIDIPKNTLTTSKFFFHRNTCFEQLFPTSSSSLWANNMLNLIKIITHSNQLDLSINYIKPMIYHSTKETK